MFNDILIKKWQDDEKSRVFEMLQNGWYPSWATSSFFPDEDVSKTYDEFMIQRIDENFDDIVKRILILCENRSVILKNAFELYKAENYIACIPLFLIQADGISDEEYGYFFSESNKGKGKAPKLICDKYKKIDENNYKHFSDLFFNLVLEIYEMHKEQKAQDRQITSRIQKNTDDNKKNGPNRSGILHGDRNHLDYGTKINACKAFSFLAFVVFSTKWILDHEK